MTYTSRTFYAEFYDLASPAVLQAGPLYIVQRFRQDDVMDALSSFELDLALGQEEARLIARHQIVVVRRIDASVLSAVYSGIVDSISIDAVAGTLKLKGFGCGRMLCWVPAGDLDIWEEASQTFNTATYPECYAGTATTPTGPDVELTGAGFPWAAFFLRGDWGGGAPHSSFLYLGRDRRWHDLDIGIDVTTHNDHVRTAQWQYYNGSTGGWADVAGLVDGTVSAGKPFHSSGLVTFAAPDDWVPVVHDAHDYYWIRVRVTNTDPTDDIIITSCSGMVIVATDTPLVDHVTPLLPAPWTIGGTTGETEHVVYAQFTQESIFEVLVKVAEQVGEHFRIFGREVIWLGTEPLTSAPAMYFEQQEDATDPDRAVVLDMNYTQETYELVSRVYPYGGGHSQAQVTLAKSTDAVPAGYAIDRANNYIRYVAAENPADPGYLGVIAKRIYCPEVAVENIAPPADELAANALLAKAVAWLSRRCIINTSYEMQVGGLKRQLFPGQRVNVKYTKFYAGVKYIDIDEDLIIVKFSEEINETGLKHTLTVSTTDELAQTDAEKVADYIEADYVMRGHPQSVPAEGLSTPTALNSQVFANGLGGVVLRSGGGSAGGTYSTTPHDILSATHDDSVADLPVRGDIIVANATPLWARLAAGALDTILAMGATDPAWVAFPGLTAAAHTAIGDAAPHHAAVTLAASAAVLMDLTGQAISLDVQTANYGFFGPATGAAAAPTFRAMVALDLPSHAHTSAGTGGDFAWADITGFAVPSNTVKLAAVEGAATTVLRSDATLALDVSIEPTWTGAHVFKKAADSATGWQVQDQDANVILDVDSVNNRVGIGATPSYLFDVQGATAQARIVSTTGTNFVLLRIGNTGGELWLGREDSVGGSLLAGGVAYATVLRSLGTYPIHVAVNATPVMTLLNGGNVGIGTVTPLLRTEISSAYGDPATSGTTPTGIMSLTTPNAYRGIYFGIANDGSTYPGWIQVSDWNDLSETRNLLLNPRGGNVGINDPAPAEQLDVTGNANVTGVYKVDDVQVVSNRVIDARCDDAINSGDATTDGVIDALRDAMIAHGLIAAA